MYKKDEIIGRPIAYKTYKMFAEQYGINITKAVIKGDRKVIKYKTMKELQKEIYDFETNDTDIKSGLYYY